MKLGPAVRDAALVAPVVVVLVLFGAFAVKEPPRPAVWLVAVGVVALRFLLVASGAAGRGHARSD